MSILELFENHYYISGMEVARVVSVKFFKWQICTSDIPNLI